MKIKKSSLLVVAGMAVLLAGCGNHATSTNNTKTDNTPKTETVKRSQNDQTQAAADQSTANANTATDNNSQSNQQATAQNNQNANNAQTKEFNNQAQAASYVTNQPGYTTGNQQGLPTVNLGDGITGTLNSGAGQQMLQWNEGNWSFTVRASAVQGQDPTPTAKQIVNELQTFYLPAPQNHGVGTFDIATNTYTLTWQKNNKVYSVSGSSPSDVIAKAVNAGKNE
ncbi:hypothetical protein A3O11_06880 [Ligilactobacillus aviarius]|uniref:hypothetical protein n=1 Tax=Ligilactobacillus aviarius TaxID=1606 RepID=UPI0007D96632|nr:hypothetical protein [Ligilactobacillus aviarius]OAQ02987.1 hypothetical protein A3O10_06500 [Ligilactobacillus aviarius]OAQ03318.1 hypothetical protein A3O11_06880 [Ligilactobacillus aviarius]OAS81428.1 hypothetical protein A3O18_02545 [Ligilactobacillus aviarius]PEG70596.1 hypothetical protein A3P04_05615 [Ligilactobacillus aviarius]PEG74002.1 hypothetical protein A3O82_03315 [Ligilactobacillus aviarius]